LRNDSPALKYAFNNVQKLNKGAGLYFHPVGDTLIPTFGKNVETFIHKVGLEEAALYLVLDMFADKNKLPSDVKKYLESFKSKTKRTIKKRVAKMVKKKVVNRATGEEKLVSKRVNQMVEKEVTVTLNALVNLLGNDSEKLDAKLVKMLKKKENFSLMVGEDFYFHDKAENLAKLVALIEATCDIDVVMTPPKSNALGVALICDLDDDASGYTVGYNENGDFRLSALGNGDLDMPAMNQQEGTLTSMSKRVLPTNAALAYGGYELNDIVRELIGAPTETIDWTAMLPSSKGFKALSFDSLPNAFTNQGIDNRGYTLEVSMREVELPKVEKCDESLVLEGEIAYRCNPARQFNDFTDKSHEIFESFALYASTAKAKSLGEKVEVVFENGSIILDVVADAKIKGNIMKVPDFKSAKDVYGLFGKSRYQTVTLRKV